jgi:hypothetical protein
MSRLKFEKKPADSKYLHHDFHILCDFGLIYVAEKYGEQGVKVYLEQLAETYYAPLIEDIKHCGLIAVKEFLNRIYEAEEASDALSLTTGDDMLNVKVKWCPAVRYMKSCGHDTSKWYIETTRVLYRAIADFAGIGFRLDSYNPENGAAEFIFWINSKKQDGRDTK